MRLYAFYIHITLLFVRIIGFNNDYSLHDGGIIYYPNSSFFIQG